MNRNSSCFFSEKVSHSKHFQCFIELFHLKVFFVILFRYWIAFHCQWISYMFPFVNISTLALRENIKKFTGSLYKIKD